MRNLREMKQSEALFAIADSNNGYVAAVLARQLFLDAGLVENPKNVHTIVNNLLSRSGEYGWLCRGLWRWKGSRDAR